MTKQLYLALYDVVDAQKERIGMQAFVVYAADEDELNVGINTLPAEKELNKQYVDVLELSHGLVLVDGREVPATIVVDEETTNNL